MGQMGQMIQCLVTVTFSGHPAPIIYVLLLLLPLDFSSSAGDSRLIFAMASEEDKALENLLDDQLKEQRESLSAIDEALASDPSNSELLSVKSSSPKTQIPSFLEN